MAIATGTIIFVDNQPHDAQPTILVYDTSYTGVANVQGVVTLSFGGTAIFSKPIAITIPVAGTGPYAVEANHGEGLTFSGLTTQENATCTGDIADPAYTGTPISVQDNSVTIYSCAASDFIAYTPATTPSTPSGSNG